MSDKRRKVFWFLLVAAVVSLAVLAFAARQTRTRANVALASTNHDEPLRAGPEPASDRIEAELITIKPAGFDPLEIRRPPGQFFLRVNNRSGIPDLQLRLNREVGERLHDVHLPRGKLNWMQKLSLPPGRYVLSEASHPEWVCTITITAR